MLLRLLYVTPKTHSYLLLNKLYIILLSLTLGLLFLFQGKLWLGSNISSLHFLQILQTLSIFSQGILNGLPHLGQRTINSFIFFEKISRFWFLCSFLPNMPSHHVNHSYSSLDIRSCSSSEISTSRVIPPPLKSICSVRSTFGDNMAYFLKILRTFWKNPAFFSTPLSTTNDETGRDWFSLRVI